MGTDNCLQKIWYEFNPERYVDLVFGANDAVKYIFKLCLRVARSMVVVVLADSVHTDTAP